MRTFVAAILGAFALCLMSCMVVVDEDDHCHDTKNTDADTVTVIFSQSPNGIAASSRINSQN